MTRLLRFRYTNWRGDDHEYVIVPDPRPGKRLTFEQPGGYEAPCWLLHGDVVTRDGDSRPEMGPTRRRSFILTKIKDLVEVE